MGQDVRVDEAGVGSVLTITIACGAWPSRGDSEEVSQMFSFQEDVLLPVRIKVIGVGGAGCNAVNTMIAIRLGPRRFYFGEHRSSGTGSFAGSL